MFSDKQFGKLLEDLETMSLACKLLQNTIDSFKTDIGNMFEENSKTKGEDDVVGHV